jgi:hypothetical protein
LWNTILEQQKQIAALQEQNLRLVHG